MLKTSKKAHLFENKVKANLKRNFILAIFFSNLEGSIQFTGHSLITLVKCLTLDILWYCYNYTAFSEKKARIKQKKK